MLHMVVMTHGPDTCAAAHPEIMEKAKEAMERMNEAASGLDVSIQGSWINPPGHTFFILADAHVVNGLTRELGLFEWNTVTVHAVMTLQEAMAMAQEGR